MKRVFIHEMDKSSKKIIERTGNQLTVQWLVLDDEMDSETEEYKTDEECDMAIEEEVSNLIEGGYMEKPQKTKSELLMEIENNGNFKIANRYREYVTHDEKDKYADYSMITTGIKGLLSGEFLRLIFLEPEYDLFEEMDIDMVFQKEGYIPLARIEFETNFLAVKIDSPECPVLYWNHETGKFESYRDSLDAFLEGLLKKN